VRRQKLLRFASVVKSYKDAGTDFRARNFIILKPQALQCALWIKTLNRLCLRLTDLTKASISVHSSFSTKGLFTLIQKLCFTSERKFNSVNQIVSFLFNEKLDLISRMWRYKLAPLWAINPNYDRYLFIIDFKGLSLSFIKNVNVSINGCF